MNSGVYEEIPHNEDTQTRDMGELRGHRQRRGLDTPESMLTFKPETRRPTSASVLGAGPIPSTHGHIGKLSVPDRRLKN